MTDPSPMSDSSPILVARWLRKSFESEGAPVRALRGVDFDMQRGEFVAVMGPSGCGKSTLLNLVAGLDTPTDGEISLAGESLVGKSEDELAIMRRRHIGIVFQFFNLLEGMSVLENVTLPAVIAGAPRKRAETRAATCSTSSGSPTRPRRPPVCCPVDNGNGLRSRAHSPTSRRSCLPTSRPVPSTPKVATKCSSSSGVCTQVASRSCS